MFSKVLKFEKLDNIRLIINIKLDIMTVLLEEKKNMSWYLVLTRKFKIKNVESFNFEKIIDKTIKIYIEKKSIEEHVTNYLKDDSVVDTIVLPNIEVINDN